MICPKCKELGQKSHVYEEGGFKTLMGHQPYYNEDGVYHNHDPNRVKESFSCSEGHRIFVKRKDPCPSCNYGKDEVEVHVEEK
jgi:hypothetical protein